MLNSYSGGILIAHNPRATADTLRKNAQGTAVHPGRGGYRLRPGGWLGAVTAAYIPSTGAPAEGLHEVSESGRSATGGVGTNRPAQNRLSHRMQLLNSAHIVRLQWPGSQGQVVHATRVRSSSPANEQGGVAQTSTSLQARFAPGAELAHLQKLLKDRARRSVLHDDRVACTIDNK